MDPTGADRPAWRTPPNRRRPPATWFMVAAARKIRSGLAVDAQPCWRHLTELIKVNAPIFCPAPRCRSSSGLPSGQREPPGGHRAGGITITGIQRVRIASWPGASHPRSRASSRHRRRPVVPRAQPGGAGRAMCVRGWRASRPCTPSSAAPSGYLPLIGLSRQAWERAFCRDRRSARATAPARHAAPMGLPTSSPRCAALRTGSARRRSAGAGLRPPASGRMCLADHPNASAQTPEQGDRTSRQNHPRQAEAAAAFNGKASRVDATPASQGSRGSADRLRGRAERTRRRPGRVSGSRHAGSGQISSRKTRWPPPEPSVKADAHSRSRAEAGPCPASDYRSLCQPWAEAVVGGTAVRPGRQWRAARMSLRNMTVSPVRMWPHILCPMSGHPREVQSLKNFGL